MKYYYREHVRGYQRVREEGKTAWHEIHGDAGFEDFPSQAFLEAALPLLRFSVLHPTVLEYGCGTGPGASFLAQRGFLVDGIDIIPTAIEMARALASKRHLDIHYEVQDICKLPHEGKRYDMIVDSYCLQGIVTDEDRARVFAVVRARLKSGGYYLVSTAMFDEKRFRQNEHLRDTATGVVYNRYGTDIFDAETSIVYTRLEEGPADYTEAIRMGGVWYLPNRRHLRAWALKAELEAAGFHVMYQDDLLGGHVICTLGVKDAALER